MAADDKRGGGLYDIEPRRSIFAALWFRVILVLIVVGVIGALAVPYVLDVVNPPAAPKPATLAQPTPHDCVTRATTSMSPPRARPRGRTRAAPRRRQRAAARAPTGTTCSSGAVRSRTSPRSSP